MDREDSEFPPSLTRQPVTEEKINPESLLAADLDGDGDGDVDIANTNSGNNTVTLYFQEPPQKFSHQPLTLKDRSLDAPTSVAAADLDTDDDLDLIVANKFGDTISLFLQMDPGKFIPHPDGPIKDQLIEWPRTVFAGDLDGDGDTDILSANVVSDSLTLFFGER